MGDMNASFRGGNIGPRGGNIGPNEVQTAAENGGNHLEPPLQSCRTDRARLFLRAQNRNSEWVKN